VRVLLDTNTFIKAYQNGIGGMPKKVQQILADPETERILSSISLTEIAIKTTVSRGLIFSHKNVHEAIEDMRLTVISYTPVHAHALFTLPFFEDHRDPFDRMLIATALNEDMPLLGSDKRFRRYKGLQMIWA
jgi:PIN domain nuclease of toxin-antitoxin system